MNKKLTLTEKLNCYFTIFFFGYNDFRGTKRNYNNFIFGFLNLVFSKKREIKIKLM